MSESCSHTSTHLDRTLCACGAMHYHCDDCGERVGHCDGDEDSLFQDIQLEVLCNMDDPPGEAFETSWLRAKELLEQAGPSGAILVLTITESGEDLASSVVLSSGYAQVPTNYILSILDHHLEALGEE